MNKKLMAVAVAGALAAPAAALAQTTIYGVFNAEYGVASQPNTSANAARHDAEGFNSGASRIGLRGEEKLGGGLAAWYQCESQLNVFPGPSSAGSISAAASSSSTASVWCGRNSAIGMKGGFGNFYVGTWDSPIKRASGVSRITNETGWLGTQHILLEPSQVADFSDRPSNTLNYDSPNLGGFTISLQATSLQTTFNATTGTVAEGRKLGLGGQYATGPIAVAAAIEKRDENCAAATGCSTSAGTLTSDDSSAWLVGATYVFGPVKLGLTYTDMETKIAGTTVERTAWNIAGEWKISGPGLIRFGYALADDLEGTVKVPSSGAKQYQISYLHNFSKRTQGYLGYVKLDNDSAGTYNLSGLSAGAANVFPGDSADAVAVGLSHTF